MKLDKIYKSNDYKTKYILNISKTFVLFMVTCNKLELKSKKIFVWIRPWFVWLSLEFIAFKLQVI